MTGEPEIRADVVDALADRDWNGEDSLTPEVWARIAGATPAEEDASDELSCARLLHELEVSRNRTGPGS